MSGIALLLRGALIAWFLRHMAIRSQDYPSLFLYAVCEFCCVATKLLVSGSCTQHFNLHLQDVFHIIHHVANNMSYACRCSWTVRKMVRFLPAPVSWAGHFYYLLLTYQNYTSVIWFCLIISVISHIRFMKLCFAGSHKMAKKSWYSVESKYSSHSPCKREVGPELDDWCRWKN
jgi:hypothetical protein